MANENTFPNVSELDVIRAYYQSVLTLDSSSPSNLTFPSTSHKPQTAQTNGEDDGTPTIKRRKGRKSSTLHTGSTIPPWNPVEGISKVHLIPLQSTSNHATCATSSPVRKTGSGTASNGNMQWRDSSTLPPDSPDFGTPEDDNDMEVDELRSSPPLDPFGMISPPKIDRNVGKANGSPVKRKKTKKIKEDIPVERNEEEGDAQSTTPRRAKKPTSAKTPTKTTTLNGDTTTETKEKKQRKKKDRKEALDETAPSTSKTITTTTSSNGLEDRMEDTDLDQNAIEDLVGSSPPVSPVKEKKNKTKAKRKSTVTKADEPVVTDAPTTLSTSKPPNTGSEDGTEMKKKSQSKRKSLLSQDTTETPATPSTPTNSVVEGKKEKKSAKKSKPAPSWVVNTPK